MVCAVGEEHFKFVPLITALRQVHGTPQLNAISNTKPELINARNWMLFFTNEETGRMPIPASEGIESSLQL